MGDTTGKNTKAISTVVESYVILKAMLGKEANKITKGYFKNLKKN